MNAHTVANVVVIEFSMSLHSLFYQSNYDDYINSDAWAEKKKELDMFHLINNLPIYCLKCWSNKYLQLHHNFYSHLGKENLSDLDYLCLECHNEWHKIQKHYGESQNKLINYYYKFLFKGKDSYNQLKLNKLLQHKISEDEKIINEYFSLPEIVKYHKINNIGGWLIILSFVFIWFYGVGLITLILAIIIYSRYKEPDNYEIFQKKKESLLLHKKILAYV